MTLVHVFTSCILPEEYTAINSFHCNTRIEEAASQLFSHQWLVPEVIRIQVSDRFIIP
jgi:hypothetical protein